MSGIKDFFTKAADAVVGTFMGGVSDIIGRFKADPTKALEISAELEKEANKLKLGLEQVGVQLEQEHTKQLDTVNQTMREEAKSEHWAQWLWRPLVGFMFVAVGVNNFIILPYLKKYGLIPVELPTDFSMAILAILGVASLGRTATKWEGSRK